MTFTKFSRWIGVVVLMISVVFWSASGANWGSIVQKQTTSTSSTLQGLIILIRFVPEALQELGVGEEEAVKKIQADLQAEIGDQIAIVAQRSDDRFPERFREALERLDRKYEVEAKRKLVEELVAPLVEANRNSNEPVGELPADVVAAIKAYENALQVFEEELRKSSNLASLPRGNIGLLITLTKGYGGQTPTGDNWPLGERWSLIHTGLAKADFASPGNPERERAFVLQYLANAAKHQIGLQFGLKENSASLDDAMRSNIDRARGEHLVRDSRPVRYNAQDRAVLIERIKEWISSQSAMRDVLSLRSVGAPNKVPNTRSSNSAYQRSDAALAVWPAAISVLKDLGPMIAGALFNEAWGMVKSGLLSGGTAADVRDFPVSKLDIELGYTFRVDFRADFRWKDHPGLWQEFFFFELYVVADNEVIYYHRYPQAGYITNPNTYFDDSTSESFKGWVYLGAKEWPCRNETKEVKVYAIVWEDRYRLHFNPSNKWIDKDQRGRVVNDIRPGYGRTMMLTEWAKDVEILPVTVLNPYSVEVQQSDHGVTKNHHGDNFVLEFDAVMNYRIISYPSHQVFTPEPPEVTININPLDSKDGWIFRLTEGALEFKFIPRNKPADKQRIKFEGRHGDPKEHHPNTTAEYADDWGAKVSGTNKVEYEKDGTRATYPYKWGAQFRPAPLQEEGCTPLPYAVKDEDPHEPGFSFTVPVGTGGTCKAKTPALSSINISEIWATVLNSKTNQPLPQGTPVTFTVNLKPGVEKLQHISEIDNITVSAPGFKPKEIKGPFSAFRVSLPGPNPVTIEIINLGTVALDPA